MSPRRLYRFVLTVIHDWAEQDPPARVQESVARVTLYSSWGRQVKATPRNAPVDWFEVCKRIASPGADVEVTAAEDEAWEAMG